MDSEVVKKVGRRGFLPDTEFVEEKIESALKKRDFAPVMWLDQVVLLNRIRCQQKAVEHGFDFREGINADAYGRLGARLLVEEAMAELKNRFVVVEVDGAEQIRRLDHDGGYVESDVKIRRQTVIDGFYVLNGAKDTETWLVAYDDFDVLEYPTLPFLINFKKRTVWISNRLRGRKAKRENEIAYAMELVKEQAQKKLLVSANGGDHD